MAEDATGGRGNGERWRTIMVRLAGEISIKSRRTRASFQRTLRANIRDALESAEAPFALDARWDRLYVRSPSEAAAPALARVFGISSLSPVAATGPAKLDWIVETGEREYAELVRGRKFAVRARRTGRHDFSSRDIMVRLGDALFPHSAGVDLDHPDVTVYVEVREETTYLFSRRLDGAGGLPLGVEGRAVVLLSGGYDSALAAWLMLKRGVAVDYVFCNLGGAAYERAVIQVGKLLADEWSYGTRPAIHIVDFAEPLRELRERAKQSYWQVVLKRLMYRTASRVARDIGAQAIVTGEAIGQVSSQTLANLAAIAPAAELPVLRPLLGFDKNEIIDRARLIGTAALSEQVKEYCAIAPGRPVTAASAAAVAAEEDKLDPAALDTAIAGRKALDLRSLTPTDLVAPYLFTADIPDDAVILDCRPRSQYEHWHLPGAESREEYELLRDYDKLDRDRHYVLYCAQGIQTAYIAEKMQRAGYEAYSFRGGIRGVMKWAEAHGRAAPRP